jgi:hypothetical protein
VALLASFEEPKILGHKPANPSLKENYNCKVYPSFALFL